MTAATKLDEQSFQADCEALYRAIRDGELEHPSTGATIGPPTRYLAAVRRDAIGYARRVLDRPEGTP